MSRLSPVRVVRGHWLGLSDRSVGPAANGQEPARYPGSPGIRLLDVAVPFVVLFATAVMLYSSRTLEAPLTAYSLDSGLAGAVIGGSSLLVAGLLSTFSQLAAWRTRYSERLRQGGSFEQEEYRISDWHIRCLIDESVAHTLLAVVDAIVLVVAASLAMVFKGWISLVATAVMAAFGAHVVILGLIIVTRVYSAYSQSEEIVPGLDGNR